MRLGGVGGTGEACLQRVSGLRLAGGTQRHQGGQQQQRQVQPIHPQQPALRLRRQEQQQGDQQQAARRAVEAEQQERSRLQSLVAKVDPLARKAEADEIITSARGEAERIRSDAERGRLEGETANRLERERVEKLLQPARLSGLEPVTQAIPVIPIDDEA